MYFPIWNSSVIQESVLFFEKDDYLEGRLLFWPKKIVKIEVWNDNSGYTEVSDYQLLEIIEENEKIIIKIKSEFLHQLNKKELLKNPNEENSYPETIDGEKWLLFNENGLFHKIQALITYKHDEKWNGIIPRIEFDINEYLKKNEELKKNFDVYFLGDSITFGANASALMNLEPKLDPYPKLLINALKKKNDNINFRYINDAVGGTSSKWGIQALRNRLEKERKKEFPFHFDLNIIAFGANDAGGKIKPKNYLKHIKKQIKLIKNWNKNAYILIVLSSLPNPLWRNARHELLLQYRDKVLRFCGKYDSLIVADITKLWSDLLKKKSIYDITGNGINHPNDFGHYLYSQFLFNIVSKIEQLQN